MWARLAAWLSFLAVLSALVAPVSMLAQDVRAGKLGGICSVNTAAAGDSDSSDGSPAQAGMHCDLCGSVGLALPALQVATVNFPADASAAVPGLPFSRGPPSP